jgi:valyl-tRNA synthetase
VGTLWHIPPNEHFKCVHLFVAAVRVAGELHQVRITVKEHLDGQKLYDQQLFKVKAPDGVSPMPAAVASEPTRPTSGAELCLGSLFDDVNTDTTFVRCQVEPPGEGWTQDPDVLDTWFSSWLWPFATMGWTGDPDTDAKNETLKAFYPTTDLVTGPDIIFFWVARMIMAGYEYMGELPFRNVYFTGIIRDKQGRKMSKSLGNSPDPLDLIGTYGADALRFGTMRSAPLGQDILFDEQNVELGRNFCNKLWNACRYRQMQGGATEGEINPALLTSDDRWILLRLDQAIREVTQAFAEYRFSDATSSLYRFFWSEYCDWYIEASKAALGSPDRAPRSAAEEALRTNTLAVIDFVIGNALRLFHPFLPFITEELWQGMSFHRDLPADQGGRSIMTAPWPKALSDDEKAYLGLDAAAESAAAAKYELVSMGRNFRREFNLPAGKKLRFVLKPACPIPAAEIEVLRLLLNAEAVDVDPAFEPPKGTPCARNAIGELHLPLTGLVDFAAERARLGRELEKARAEVAKVQEKLANPNFTQKVPAKVLEEHQRRLDEWRTKVAQIEQAIANLPG